MKAKRFLSIFVAIVMMVSCFVVTASAETNAAIKDTTKAVSLTIVLEKDTENGGLSADVDGDETDPGNTKVHGAEFSIYLVTNGTAATTATATGTTDSNGSVSFAGLAQGRYLVKNTVQAPGTEAAYQDFYVDLPNTKVDGTGYIYDVTVYPKQIVTGAVKFTKTFNGVATVPDGVTANFKLQKKNADDTYTDVTGTTFEMTNTAGNVWEIDGLEFGTYRIVETSVEDTNDPAMYASTDDKNGDDFVISAGGAFDATVTDGYVGTVVTTSMNNTSSTEPSVEKKVSADGSNFGDSASINAIDGDAVATWQITATLPNDIANYSEYVITDNVDDRLVPDWTSLKITGIDEANRTVTASGQDLTITLKNFSALTEGDIVITFTTTYKDLATDVGSKIPNDVEVTYKNSSNTPGKIDNHNSNTTTNDDLSDDPTPDHDPYIWTGAIYAEKVSSENADTKLANAEFKIYSTADCSGTALYTATSDADGTFSFVGLKAGTYYLLETKAPTGYELNGTPTKIVIAEDDDTITNDITEKMIWDLTGNAAIVNIPSTDLPLTGGMGTGLFSMLGLAFVTVGGVFLFKSKKAKASV